MSMSNPFWTEVLERWKVILRKMPPNLTLPYTNVYTPTLQIKNYKYIPLISIVNEQFDILPPSQLRERLPLADWRRISAPLLSFSTAKIRAKCKKVANFTGNFFPHIHPIMQLTSPNIKGCREFSKLICTNTFVEADWPNFAKFSSTHQISPDRLQRQITKLAKTSRLIEARDLQFLVLRNTCITNIKLYKMHILDSPKCQLCTYPQQDSAHRFFLCTRIKPVWALLSEILESTSSPHTFSHKCAILNIEGVPKNHPLTLLTNYTRLLIDKAHTSGNNIHPNTFLYKILHLADIFYTTNSHRLWAEILERCKTLLSPFNPQILAH